MTFETFIEELRKIPDKNILLKDDLSPDCVTDFKISRRHLVLILQRSDSKSYSVRSLARQLLPLENIIDVYVSYGIHCFKVNSISLNQDSVTIHSSIFSDYKVSL